MPRYEYPQRYTADPSWGGGRLSQMVSLIDLPPTLLDAAGIELPAHMQGRSILPLVNRETTEWQDEVFVQYSESEVGRAIRSKRWKYAVSAPGKDSWQDSHSDSYIEAELYDLLADPYELNNLAGLASHRVVCDVLRSRLIKRMIEAGEDEPIIEPAPLQPDIGGQLRVTTEDGWQ